MNHPALQRALQDANEGHLQRALAAVRVLVAREPRWSDALVVLGVLLQRDGKQQQALHHFERAVKVGPNSSILRTNFGNALLQAGREREAIREFREAIRLDAGDQAAWEGLIMAQFASGDQVAAIGSGEAALRRWPDWVELAQIHLNALFENCRVDEVLRFAADWLSRRPHDTGVLATYAYARNFRSHPEAEIAATHRTLGELLNAPMTPPPRGREPDRPLRLGVLSGDLREHSVAYFFECIVRRIPADFQWTVFSTEAARPQDAVAARFRGLLPDWHEVGAMSADELDREIRTREIDVLVELSGYTNHSRLHMLVRKPAPVILHAFGYPNTTGFAAIDWRVVDSITDPPATTFHGTERLLRLDPCFLCYQPPAAAPEPSLPVSASPFTFGSFNNDSKVGPETIRLWGRVLDAVPGSRLLLKSRALANPANFEVFAARIEAGGIARDRFKLAAFAPSLEAHLALYGQVHVALDPTPYNGTTTTCEALWMGVPVVALEGDRHVSRVSSSLLQAAGFPEWVAKDETEYCQIALALAGSGANLSTLRQSIRARMRDSVLLDAEAYASRFYRALRRAWRDWCGTEDSSGTP